MTQQTSLNAREDERPARRHPLTVGAVAYLTQLHLAAGAAVLRRDQAALAVRDGVYRTPRTNPQATQGGPGALKDPVQVVEEWRQGSLEQALANSEHDAARAAWWYATAALAALRSVVTGRPTSALHLERVSLHEMDSTDRRTRASSPAWVRCLGVLLPAAGDLDTGISRLDTAMSAALGKVRPAYTAAITLEQFAGEPFDGPAARTVKTDWPSLADAETAAAGLPDALIAYADTVSRAAIEGRRSHYLDEPGSGA